ncbi:MAG: Na/Pi cotransporter family protein [Bacillota bacterium]|nr:Na/Pi cotransporter family protein [Bacillota bacterium]
MTFLDSLQLVGGLALFLYGMHLLSESLERRAGLRLKRLLEHLTSSPLRGVLLGTFVTAIIQSSSATTVMVVGFVNSGIMKLRQAIYVVMGANIGTTVTAWLLSLTGLRSDNVIVALLKPDNFSPILAAIGIIMIFTVRRERGTAGILLGFAILMYGMSTMSTAVAGLATDPSFQRLMVLFSNPVFGVLVGTFITALIQSSSASVGILQAIAATGSITHATALPIIMGQNIGTCITAILSSIGANRNAKRVAAVHLYFNILGTVAFLSIYYLINSFIHFPFMDDPITPAGIAFIHTTFNVLGTIVMLPLAGALERLAIWTIRDDKSAEVFEILDERLLATPSIAIEQAHKLTCEMAEKARESVDTAMAQLDSFDPRAADHVHALEERVDLYEDKLGNYLVLVSMRNLAQPDSREVARLLHIIGDLERISDHAVNIVRVAEEIHAKRIAFSPEATREVATIRAAVAEVLELATTALTEGDYILAERVEPLEEVVDRLRSEIKIRHITRLQSGVCTIELGFVLTDLLTNLERISDHCSNIAASLTELEQIGSMEQHEYTRSLREGAAGVRFNELLAEYSERYALGESP